MAGTDQPVNSVYWPRAVRIVSSQYPPIGFFDEVADPADLEAVLAVEQLTNPRLREQVGQLGLVAPADRISGPGTTPVMAAFTHPNPEGSRFSPGWYGVYYAAWDEATAIAETRYHRQRLMRYQDIGPQQLQMRAYVGAIEADLVDLRGLRNRYPDLHDPDSYQASQPFAAGHREAGAWGIAYGSVRRSQGQCFAIFRPAACQPVVQATHYVYYYNGRDIEHVAELREVSARQ